MSILDSTSHVRHLKLPSRHSYHHWNFQNTHYSQQTTHDTPDRHFQSSSSWLQTTVFSSRKISRQKCDIIIIMFISVDRNYLHFLLSRHPFWILTRKAQFAATLMVQLFMFMKTKQIHCQRIYKDRFHFKELFYFRTKEALRNPLGRDRPLEH